LNDADVQTLAGGGIEEKEEKEEISIVDEELTEEHLNQKEEKEDLPILTNIAVEPEIEETKKINYNQGKNE
jgi:hypothetical protein